jgi:hypothetical protein
MLVVVVSCDFNTRLEKCTIGLYGDRIKAQRKEICSKNEAIFFTLYEIFHVGPFGFNLLVLHHRHMFGFGW